MDLVPQQVERTPPDAAPCVFHSHATCQMPETWRQRFAAMLEDLGRRRHLASVSLEWLHDDPGPRLQITEHRGGTTRSTHLADGHFHGRWVQWRAEPTVSAR